MRHRWIPVAAILLFLSQPILGQETGDEVAPQNSYAHHSFMAQAGVTYALTLELSGPAIDVLLLNETEFRHYEQEQPFNYSSEGSRLNVQAYQEEFSLPHDGIWYFVVDNRNVPPGGAQPQGTVTVRFHLSTLVYRDISEGSFGQAITLQRDYWRVTPTVGIAGLALWLVALAVLCIPRQWQVLAWTGVVAAVTFLHAVVVRGNVLVNLSVPLGLGLLVGYAVPRSSRMLARGARDVYFATFVGVFVGADVLALFLSGSERSAVRPTIIGGAGFQDVLFLAPAATLAFFFVARPLMRMLSEESETREPERDGKLLTPNDWVTLAVLLVVLVAIAQRLAS